MGWKDRSAVMSGPGASIKPSWKDRSDVVPHDNADMGITPFKREDVEAMANGKFGDTGRVASSPGEKLDSVVGSPVRALLDSLIQKKGLVQAGKDSANAFSNDPKNQPTGFDVANHAGVENPYLGTAVATAIDVGAQLPVGLMAKGASKIGAMASEGAGNMVSGFAKRKAFKALEPTKAAQDAAEARGLVEQIGGQGLDEGVVSPLASKKTMFDRAETLSDKKGNQLSGLLEDIRNNKNLTPEQAAQVDASRFNPKLAADKLKGELRDKYPDFSDRLMQGRENQIEDFLAKDEPFDIVRSQSLKKNMNDFIKDSSYWKNNPSASQEGLMDIRRSIKEGIEHNADAYAGIAGEHGGQVKDLNRSLGNNLEMSNILADTVSRNAKNRSVSLTDYLLGGAGAAAFGPKGIALALANKVARAKGNQVMATGANAVSKMLLQSPSMQALAEKDPSAFEQAIINLTSQMKSGKTPLKVADRTESKNKVAGD